MGSYDDITATIERNGSPLSVNGSTSRAAWPRPVASSGLHGVAGEFVRIVAPETEADPVGLLVQFLVSAGSIMGRTSWCEVEATRHYANLFCCMVGKSANARKGTSKAQVNRFLRHCASLDYDGSERVRHWLSECQLSGLASGEGLIWSVRDPVYKFDPKAGNEILMDPGIEDKRLLCHEAEFGSVLQVAARERSTLSTTIRQAWDSGSLRNASKGSPARSTDAHIAVIGHITNHELKTLLSSNDAANGFGNRFLWVSVRRSQQLPMGGNLDLSSLDDIGRRFLAAVEFAHERPHRMEFDREAENLWCESYSELSRERFGLFGSLTSRAEANTLRLALLYAMLDRADEIHRHHLDAALAVWRYCEDSTRYIFGTATGDPAADLIRDELWKAGDHGLTRTEISSLFQRNKSAAEIDQALALLRDSGFAERRSVPSDGPGRPAEVWVIRRDEQTKETNQTKELAYELNGRA